MKNALGRTLILFALVLNVWAQPRLADYELTSAKSELYVKEAVEIKFVAKQIDHEHIMYFFLEPKQSRDYKIVLLNKEAVELVRHDKVTTFTFLLFPLKSGYVTVDFDFTVKVASDEAVAQVFEGSRDNVKWIETINTKIALKPLALSVKALQKAVDLVGEFEIASTLDKNSIDSYESANIRYNLTGVGYNDFSLEPIDETPNATLFSSVTQHYEKATPEGYEIHRELNYALVAPNDVKVKAKAFKCYSPKRDEFYEIATKEFDIKVSPIKKSTLIDEEDYPKTENYFEQAKNIAIYLIVFLSGYFTAKYAPSEFSKKTAPYQDVREAKNAKELLFVLMRKYDKRSLQRHYETLNAIAYEKANPKEFKKIKKQILQDLA